MLRRTSRYLPIAAPVAVALLLSPAFASAQVWVITDRQHPVQGKPDRLIELDAPPRIEQELTAGLPRDSSQAAALVQRRLNQGGNALQQRLGNAYQGVADAWSLGVQKIPAVVVDKRYVVYGETDVARAVARIAQHRERRP
ncbi:TIGR03757 family integrating conjugative element protein [Burkholderia pyrrocinia]|uniref:TIGR03757 family integrating conjugative element protein n=1 Tax=Burkholderia pyrrocinia TaxID=60550 RepID=UPI001FB38D02|nr:TIGR03757 family integrating conjugative element protein [Burkholderia pyrrocinia]UOB56995.1 TIGR03757 family integrating conjugative element protein [Burkholderia pyrrocinia]